MDAISVGAISWSSDGQPVGLDVCTLMEVHMEPLAVYKVKVGDCCIVHRIESQRLSSQFKKQAINN